MRAMLEAIAAVPISAIAKYAAIGGAAGFVATPLLVLLSMKTNYKHMRDIYAATRIPQNARLYRIFAFAGAALFAIVAGSQPVLDAAGENESYIRAALIPVIAAAVGIPFVRALKRLRKES